MKINPLVWSAVLYIYIFRTLLLMWIAHGKVHGRVLGRRLIAPMVRPVVKYMEEYALCWVGAGSLVSRTQATATVSLKSLSTWHFFTYVEP